MRENDIEQRDLFWSQQKKNVDQILNDHIKRWRYEKFVQFESYLVNTDAHVRCGCRHRRAHDTYMPEHLLSIYEI